MTHALVRPVRLAAIAGSLVAASVGSLQAQEILGAGERNLFEWIQVAPVVVAAQSVGNDGNFHRIRVQEVLRGEVATGDTLSVDIRYANRNRDRLVDSKALILEPGEAYVFLLQRMKPRKSGDPPVYRLVRGVRSVRELPGEGREPFLDALRRFREVQDRNSEAQTWDFLEQALGETNPILLEVALAQFRKFRRGTPQLLPGLRPLLFHPDGAVRVDATALIGQILERFPPSDLADEISLRTDLVARARGDRHDDVRVAATEALAHFDPAKVDEVLEEIAESDPEQNVRYAATRVLVAHRQEKAAQHRAN